MEVQFLDPAGIIVANLQIFAPANKPNTIFRLEKTEALELGEEPLQLVEGTRYEFEFIGHGSKNLRLREESGNGVVESSTNPQRKHCGGIITGLNVGRMGLLAADETGKIIGRARMEVRSSKLGYRNDYHRMMEDISRKCVELLMELRGPSATRVAPDPGRTFETLQQRFEFLKNLIGSRRFLDALHRISTYPHRRWEPEESMFNIRRKFRPDGRSLRELARSSRRLPLPDGHPIKNKIGSLPERIPLKVNIQTEDTPENRFIKFALQSFFGFLNQIRHKLIEFGNSADTRIKEDISLLENRLEIILEADFLRDVSAPDMLPLGSPVLQRKGGYREIYQAWLTFDLAARLVWRGGEDVYGAGQRDIAALYEYWVFFELFEIVSSVSNLEKTSVRDLIEETEDGFGLKLKTGKDLSFYGSASNTSRPLKVRFSYNRSFIHNPTSSRAGSWTERMRPDYTLSLWPEEFSEEEAESQEIMTHLHFDAKYRIEKLEQLFGQKDESLKEAEVQKDLSEEKKGEKNGRYKRIDLLKMHAYRDAIRRTQGAFVIYPGSEICDWRGYHEVLPGLGAFPLRPEYGRSILKDFVREVIDHLSNYASAMERQSFHTFRSQKNPAKFMVLKRLPEYDKSSHFRLPPPAETFVLIGWYKNYEHLRWILNRKLYNFRMNTSIGSLRLRHEIFGASYLLLHSYKGESSQNLFRISEEGPRVFSKEKLKELGYPGIPTQDFYLVFDVEPDPEFNGYEWNYLKLSGMLQSRHSAIPQTVTLDELMSTAKIKPMSR